MSFSDSGKEVLPSTPRTPRTPRLYQIPQTPRLPQSPSASTTGASTIGAPTGIASLLSSGNDVEIVECDKTGHVRRKWLHTADNRVIPVPLSRSPSTKMM